MKTKRLKKEILDFLLNEMKKVSKEGEKNIAQLSLVLSDENVNKFFSKEGEAKALNRIFDYLVK